MLKGQYANHHLQRAGRSAEISEIALRRRYRHVTQRIADGLCLDAVAVDRAQAVGGDKSDVGRFQLRGGNRRKKGVADGRSLARLPVAARLEGGGAAEDAGEDLGAAGLSVPLCFKNQHSRSFTVHHAVAQGVEGARRRGGVAAVLRLSENRSAPRRRDESARPRRR